MIPKTATVIRSFITPGHILQAAGAAIILITLYLISLRNYLLFHGIIEVVTIAIAFSIFILVWNNRRIITDAFFLIIGISFLFTGIIDLVHTFAYLGMGVFPGSTADLPTQLWIAARYFQSIMILIATLYIGRSITKDQRYDVAIIIMACTAASGLLLASIFVWQDFPHCFIEGIGLTPFKIVSEYIISIILIATAVVLYIKRRSFDPDVWRFLIAAQIFLVFGELAFTTYVSVYGFTNMLGHLFKFVSFYFFYSAIVVVGLTRPYDLLFRDLVENINDVIFSMDNQGKITYVSPAISRLYGYDPDQVRGQDFIQFVHPDDQHLYEEWFRRRKRGERGENEFRIHTRDGRERYIRTTACPVIRGGMVGEFTCTLTDITDRKRIEEALRKVNKKLNLLSSITRHDINNQIFSLKAFLELSKETLGDAAKMSEYIIKEERAAEAIERQIIFTKEYQDMGVEAPGWQNVAASIQKPLTVLLMRDIRVIVEINNLEVYADPLFEKVFYNLIDNALRYGGQGMTMIRISSQESEQGLMITVEDDGVGISTEDKKRLFERGFGYHTGLGLFLSREILSITGIAITENGEPGTGARFGILVPKGWYRFTKK